MKEYLLVTGVGLLAQGFFSLRMLHQWIKTEKAKKIISPSLFWVFSICGSCLLMLYGWLREDFAIILGQFLSYYIYIWNLNANGIWQKTVPWLRLIITFIPPAAALSLAAGGADIARTLFDNPDIPLPLLLFGCAAQALFTLRFVYQWWYSRARRISVLPMGFWVISLTGSVLICLYGLIRLDVVLILGQALGLCAYVRNIMIGLRDRQEKSTPQKKTAPEEAPVETKTPQAPGQEDFLPRVPDAALRVFLYLFGLALLLPLVYVFGTNIMEARNLISAQSMALDGDWLIPHLYTEIRLNKPPLPVWLTAPVFLLSPHPSMFALHLPVILVSALLGVFAFDLHRALSGQRREAFYAGLAAASMLLTLKLGTANSWDIYSVVFMTGALVCLLRQGKGALVAGVFLMAASVLSKGPVQLYTMLLPLVAALLVCRRPVPWKRLAVILFGGCILGSLWYVYVYLAVPHVAAEVAKGEVSAWSSRHLASFFFYLSFPAFAGAWALPSLAGFACRRLDREHWEKNKVLLLWFLFSLLLLSLVPEKKERYLMPAMVPLALLCAATLRHWTEGLTRGTLNLWEKRLVTVHLGLGTAAAVGLCLFVGWSHSAYLPWALLFALLCLGLGFLDLKKPARLVPVSCLMVLCVVLAAFRMGSTRPVVQKTPPTCSLEELRSLPRLQELPCYSFDGFGPTEEWETGKDTTHITSLDNVPETRFLLLDTDTTPPAVLNEPSPLRVVERFLVQTSRNAYITLFIVEKK